MVGRKGPHWLGRQLWPHQLPMLRGGEKAFKAPSSPFSAGVSHTYSTATVTSLGCDLGELPPPTGEQVPSVQQGQVQRAHLPGQASASALPSHTGGWAPLSADLT